MLYPQTSILQHAYIYSSDCSQTNKNMHAEEQIPWKEKLNICLCEANQVHPRGAILIPAMCPRI